MLAKPRQWNRLTEKGREAFRRIYAWISDERAIDLLCAISPRRIATTGKYQMIKLDNCYFSRYKSRPSEC